MDHIKQTYSQHYEGQVKVSGLNLKQKVQLLKSTVEVLNKVVGELSKEEGFNMTIREKFRDIAYMGNSLREKDFPVEVDKLTITKSIL